MKKYLLFATILLQTSFLFGQSLGSSTGNVQLNPEHVQIADCDESRPEIRKSLSYYSEWRNVSCYSKIQYRIAAFSLGIIRGTRRNSWKVQFKNNYSKYIAIKYKVYVGNELRTDENLEIEPKKYWGIDCAGGTDGILSESLSLDYKLEINVKFYEISDYILKSKPLNFDCDGSLSVPAYKSFYPTNNIENPKKEQQRQQQLQQGINQLATATSDLITFLASRKKASKSALSKEDGQILLGIVNSESPFDYTQNIIDIFSDLGYTLKETSKSSDGSLTISMFDNSTIQWPLYIHIYLPSKYNDYNRISFSYQRKKVLINQLWVINDNLVEGWNLKGLSPSKQKEIEEKNIEKNKKKLEEESKALEKESIAKDNMRKIDEITPIKTDKIIDSSITVQSILNNCILAMGGEYKLKAVVSVTKYCENEEMSYYTIQTFGKYAYTGSYKGKSSKLVFDGINGYNEYDGKKSVLTENLISIYKKSQPFEILELKARNDLKIGSIETIGNKEYITIIAPPRIINGDSYSDKLYFDIVNGLYLGTSTFYSYKSFKGLYKNIVSYNFYYDYKEINKIKFPFTNITTSGDTYYTKTIITKIMLNEPLTDNDFK